LGWCHCTRRHIQGLQAGVDGQLRWCRNPLDQPAGCTGDRQASYWSTGNTSSGCRRTGRRVAVLHIPRKV